MVSRKGPYVTQSGGLNGRDGGYPARALSGRRVRLR